MSWLDYLQDTSWNGVPFGVFDAQLVAIFAPGKMLRDSVQAQSASQS